VGGKKQTVEGGKKGGNAPAKPWEKGGRDLANEAERRNKQLVLEKKKKRKKGATPSEGRGGKKALFGPGILARGKKGDSSKRKGKGRV